MSIEFTTEDQDYIDWLRFKENHPEAYAWHEGRAKRWNKVSQGWAWASSMRWTKAEDDAVMASGGLMDTARELGRTYAACVRRRQLLRKQLRGQENDRGN